MWWFITDLTPTLLHFLHHLNRTWNSPSVIPSSTDKESLFSKSFCSRKVHSNRTEAIFFSFGPIAHQRGCSLALQQVIPLRGYWKATQGIVLKYVLILTKWWSMLYHLEQEEYWPWYPHISDAHLAVQWLFLASSFHQEYTAISTYASLPPLSAHRQHGYLKSYFSWPFSRSDGGIIFPSPSAGLHYLERCYPLWSTYNPTDSSPIPSDHWFWSPV